MRLGYKEGNNGSGCQSHAAVELSIRGSGGSGGVPASMCGLRRFTRLEGTGFSNLERSTAPNSALGVSQISGSGLDLLGGILKLILELRYRGR